MATIDAGDVLRMALALNLNDGQKGNLIFHYLASGGSGGDPAVILAALLSNIEAGLELGDSNISSVVGSDSAILWKWNSLLDRWDGVASSAASGFTGDAVTEVLPNQNAAQIDFFTDVPRRQGRKYIPGLVEAAQAGGDLTAGAIADMVVIAGYFDNQVVASGITLDPGVFNTVPTSPYFETFEKFTGSTSVETYMSTQRRRKPGVGI